jgi:HlyD family secretion protein
MKRWLLLLAACGGDRGATVAATTEQPRAVIAQGEVIDRVLLTGELRAGVAIDLTVPMTETWELTIRWMAEDGTAIKGGDKVLEFDNSAFTNGLVQKKIAVTEANSALRAYRDVSAVSLSVKQHELEQARVAAEKAKLLAAVPADLLPQRTVQDRLLDKTRTELALAKAEKDLATERQAVALEGRVKQIEVDKAARAVETAEKAIGELVVKAPRDGAISVGTHPWEGRRFQIGDSVQPGFTIITLPDFSQPMEVKAELSDVDDGRVKVGQHGHLHARRVSHRAPAVRGQGGRPGRAQQAAAIAAPDVRRVAGDPEQGSRSDAPRDVGQGRAAGREAHRAGRAAQRDRDREQAGGAPVGERRAAAGDPRRLRCAALRDRDRRDRGRGRPMRAALALLVVAACGKQAGELQFVDIKKADLVIGVNVSGALEAVDSTDIKPPPVPDLWNFKISSMAPDGINVKEGMPLVGFDPSELARELENYLNEVEAAKKKLEKKRDDMALARREEELALANAEATVRKATLKAEQPGELVASVELKALQLDKKAAELGLELTKNKASQTKRSDEAEMLSLREKLTYATLRADQLQKSIEKMTVTAARAGTIVYPTSWRGEKKKVGDSTWRMEVVLQVVGLDKMIGRGEVDEIEMARVAKVQPVTLRLDALPDVQLIGKVDSIARAVRSKSQADPSKVVEIKIALEPTKVPLRPGMRFRGEVEIERIKEVVQIPSDAVFVTPAGPVAYRESGGKVEQVALTLGKRSSSMIEVKGGLSAGDRVSRVDPTARGK